MRSIKLIAYCAAISILIPPLSESVYAQVDSKEVEVIEIRNYLVKPGQRDTYVEGFETYFIDTLNAHGNYVLGQYRVKGEPDNFVWIRGFEDMPARKKALEDFFSSLQWEKYGNIPGEHLLGYTNVYLLKPLNLADSLDGKNKSFPTAWFGRSKRVAVVDFYVANEMLNQLIEFVDTKYDSLVRAAGVKDITYWVSETSPNNFPGLPAFQDKNLLVSIAFYKDEQEYEEMTKKLVASMDEESKFTFAKCFTTKNTWVLYPTNKSFTTKFGGEKSSKKS